MTSLAHALLDAGIIQFGLFNRDLFILHFDYLSSYPDLLKKLVDVAVLAHDFQQYDYLVADLSSLPIAAGVSLHLHIPLVQYSADETTSPKAFAGAYDVGHPACLVLNHFKQSDENYIQQLIHRAQTVGLEIQTVFCILSEESGQSTTTYLIHFAAMLDEFKASGRISAVLYNRILGG